jgi:hypothetical protein
MRLAQKDYIGNVWRGRSMAGGSLIGTVKAVSAPETVVVT